MTTDPILVTTTDVGLGIEFRRDLLRGTRDPRRVAERVAGIPPALALACLEGRVNGPLAPALAILDLDAL
jgi:hypothetical protein